MSAIIIIMGITIFILIAIVVANQRQMRHICRQLSFLLEKDSNLMITKQYGGKNMKRMIELLNAILNRERQEKCRYREKEQLISNTYTNLSHDIRTPLTSLDGYFQLLRQTTKQEEQERYIGIIQERIDSLKAMLEELFIFTKLKNDSFEIALEKCNLTALLTKLILSYYEDWKNNNITPQIQLEEESLFIMGNELAVQRSIQNVIKNALDHGKKELSFSLEKQEKYAVIRIGNRVEHPEDIDAERVFEQFYKADAARSRTSSGLGLSIAKEFTTRMNGDIKAQIEKDWFFIEFRYPLMV